MAPVLFAIKFDPDNADSMALVDDIENVRNGRKDDLFSVKAKGAYDVQHLYMLSHIM